MECLGELKWCCAPSTTDPRDESLIELYKRFRRSEPPTTRRTLLDGLFFNPQRYNLAKVGRHKINKKLGFDPSNDSSTLTTDDIVATMLHPSFLHDGEEGYVTDDIDHRQPPHPYGGRTYPEPVPHRPVAHGRGPASA